MTKRGFSFLELMLSMVILGILASAMIPTTKAIVKRRKETELRHALMEVRLAIDRYKKMAEEGEINVPDVTQLGYPADFQELISGAALKKHSGKNIRFLRRIPTDPMTGEAEWGMRSVQDSPDDPSWGGENLFDIYSLSDGTGLDGTPYSEW